MQRSWWIGAVVSLCSLAAVLALAEWLLILNGYQVAPQGGNSHFDIGSKYGWAQLDPDTGWKNKEGVSVSMEPGNVDMTFWSHGRRATRATPELNPNLPTAIILGDSISQGYGIVDAETYGYIVQARHPDWTIENLATGGYGGYQSLLMLRKVYVEKFLRPKLVVYAYAAFHANRDVANFPWVETFINQKGEWFAPPNAIVRDGKLVEQPLTIYPAWPYEHESRLVRVLKRAYVKALYTDRQKYEDDVAKAVIGDMRRLSESNGARFLVLQLTVATPGVDQYFRETKTNVVDCQTDLNSPQSKVGGVGHPSGIVHAAWAECLDKWMSRSSQENR